MSSIYKSPVSISKIMSNSESKKNCIFVGGVPPTVTPDAVKAYFLQFGPVSKIKMNKSRGNQREKSSFPVLHRGCGFIEMATQDGLNKVLQVREHFLYDQKLDCRLAMTNRERKSYHQTLNQERRKIFIGKLPKTITKETIEAFFSQLVAIEDTTLIQKDSKDFAICFLLLKEKYAGEKLAGKSFEIAPSVIVDCQMALFPQQLHQRKLAETNSSEPELFGSSQRSGDEEDEDTMPAYDMLGLSCTESPYHEESRNSDSRGTGHHTNNKGDRPFDNHLSTYATRSILRGTQSITTKQHLIHPETSVSTRNQSKVKPGKHISSLVHFASSSTQGTSQDFSEQECLSRRWVGQLEKDDHPLPCQNEVSSGVQVRMKPRNGCKGGMGASLIFSNQTVRPSYGSLNCISPFHSFGTDEEKDWSPNFPNTSPSQHWSLYRRLKLLKLGKPTQRPGFPRLYSPFCF